MGKRIIIKSANFATNGMQDTYVEKTTTTEQGFINCNQSSAHVGKLGDQSTGVNSGQWGYDKYVHANTSITLMPGDTIAILELPGNATAVTIAAVTMKSSYANMYPSLICQSSVLLICDVSAAAIGGVPRIYTNKSSSSQKIILTAGTWSSSAPNLTAGYVQGVENANANTPTITYRIYTDHPENYTE